MNRIRCTKLLLLIVFLGLFAYLMLKDEPMCTSVADPRDRITSREIGGMLFEGEQYILHRIRKQIAAPDFHLDASTNLGTINIKLEFLFCISDCTQALGLVL